MRIVKCPPNCREIQLNLSCFPQKNWRCPAHASIECWGAPEFCIGAGNLKQLGGLRVLAGCLPTNPIQIATVHFPKGMARLHVDMKFYSAKRMSAPPFSSVCSWLFSVQFIPAHPLDLPVALGFLI
eukprot:s636_g12.t1